MIPRPPAAPGQGNITIQYHTCLACVSTGTRHGRTLSAGRRNSRRDHRRGGHAQTRTDYRDHRPGRFLSGGIPAGPGVRGLGAGPGPVQSPSPPGTPATRRGTTGPRGPAGPGEPDLGRERVQPAEVYNLAAISYVPMSWQQAELTGEVTGL